LCAEAIQYHFITVCVNSLYTHLAVEQCSGTGVGVCSVVGFPLGAVPTPVKCAETKGCLEQGAAEIDMVIPIGLMKAGLPGRVLEDIQAVAAVAHEGRARLKVILEMAYLTREEKILACLLSQAAGADYVKTSTGFGPSGATVEDVDLMRRVVGEQTGVKAAGGIRNLDQAVAMIRAGANRLGSSSGIVILAEAENLEKQVTVL
jgi:deoxyribose-phosphate aldolase